MKFLGTLLKIVLGIFILLLLVAGFTFLAWWMHWPPFTGIFIVAGLIGCVLLFFAGRLFWRLRNKRRFVQEALSGLKILAPAASGAAVTPLESRWNQLLPRDGFSHAVDPRDFLHRVWHVALDATGTLSPLFVQRQKAWEAADGIARHDFPQASLLQITRSALDGEQREDLLTLMARDLKPGALADLILVIRIEDLLDGTEVTLNEQGHAFAARLYELMATLNRDLPLYVLIEGMERIPGGSALLSRPGLADRWAGRFFASDTTSVETAPAQGTQASEAAEAEWRLVLYDDLVAGATAFRDELLALENLRSLGAKLDCLFASLLQDAPRRDPLRLSGVFFCGAASVTASLSERVAATPAETSAQTTDPRRNASLQAAAARFFTRTLPARGSEARSLRGRFAVASTGWLVGMGAWFLILLGICGLMAAETLYQKQAIVAEPDDGDYHPADPAMAALHRQLHYIVELDDARRRWLLPIFGHDVLARVIQEEKLDYTRKLQFVVLTPLITELRATLSRTRQEGYTGRQHAALTQLSWLGNALVEQTKAPTLYFSLTRAEGWNAADSAMIRAGLNWSDNRPQLELLADTVGASISRFIGDNFNLFSDSIISYYNDANIDQQVCLSDYWTHIAIGSEKDDYCIPAYYTAASYKINTAFFKSFVSAARSGTGSDVSRQLTQDANAVMNTAIRRMFDAYLKTYAEYWQTFVQRFCEAAVAVEESSVYAPWYNVRSIADTPHLKLIRRLDKELAPLAEGRVHPRWLADARLFSVMLSVALEGHHSGNPGDWHTLLVAGLNMPDALRVLWDKADNQQHMRQIYDSIMGMVLYLSSLGELLDDLENPAYSLGLARTHFAGKDAEALAKSPYTLAQKRLSSAKTIFPDSDAPQIRLFSNLLAFAGNGITLEAALALQKDWGKKVLSSPVNLYKSGDSEKMYGEKGVVTGFVNAEALPFLDVRPEGALPAIWDGRPFPFTQEFLAYLGSSMEWAMRTHDANALRTVLLRGNPPLVNADARLRPDRVLLTLHCQDKSQQLINRNYPHDEYFTYDKARCGKTDLQVDFPNFELTRSWPDFTAFLAEYRYGEKKYTPADFPESAEKLENAGIQTLKIRIFPDNVAELLRERNTAVPVVPEVITYVKE